MKRSIFAVFAALTLLLAAPVLAQQEENEPYETRTQPGADNISGQSGLTITGTVVEWNDEQLKIRTATGVEHIQILPNTDRPVELTPGETVSVDYTRTSQGVMIAQEIRPQGTVTGDEVDVTTSELTTDTETMDAEVQAEAEVETDLDTTTDVTVDEDFDADADLDAQAELDTDADLDTTVEDEDSLPATGSELPLLGLLGLLSVAAAIGVRSFLR